jgi:hypothetical protein
MNTLALIGGVICMAIPFIFYIPEIKKADSFKEKCLTQIKLLFEPFVGVTSLFYLGFLLVLYGIFAS